MWCQPRVGMGDRYGAQCDRKPGVVTESQVWGCVEDWDRYGNGDGSQIWK